MANTAENVPYDAGPKRMSRFTRRRAVSLPSSCKAPAGDEAPLRVRDQE